MERYIITAGLVEYLDNHRSGGRYKNIRNYAKQVGIEFNQQEVIDLATQYREIRGIEHTVTMDKQEKDQFKKQLIELFNSPEIFKFKLTLETDELMVFEEDGRPSEEVWMFTVPFEKASPTAKFAKEEFENPAADWIAYYRDFESLKTRINSLYPNM
jgi:hypothetical protein